MPGISSIPASFAAPIAFLIPVAVSWSVRAIAERPDFLASAITSVGVKVPSDSVECTCRSTILLSIVCKSFHIINK